MAEDVKVSKFSNARRDIVKFFREVKSELKRVIWPTRQQLINNTATVLLACLVIGAIIWVADAAFGKVAELILTR